MPYDGCFDNIYFVPESELLPDLQSQALKKISILFENEIFPQCDWESFEEKKVAGWSEIKPEIPPIDEIINDGKHKILTNSNIREEELTDMEEDDNNVIGFPYSGIKLGGYIRWCQGVDYQTCPDCGVMMTITFLQMESTTLFPFMLVSPEIGD